MPTLLRESAGFVRAGNLTQPIAATYPMSPIKDAVEHAIRGARGLPIEKRDYLGESLD